MDRTGESGFEHKKRHILCKISNEEKLLNKSSPRDRSDFEKSECNPASSNPEPTGGGVGLSSRDGDGGRG